MSTSVTQPVMEAVISLRWSWRGGGGGGGVRAGERRERASQVRGHRADPWTSRICAGGWRETVRRWRRIWSRVYYPWSSCPPLPAKACSWRRSMGSVLGATLGGVFGFNQALRHQAPVELLQVRIHTLPIRLAHLHHVVHIQQLGTVH